MKQWIFLILLVSYFTLTFSQRPLEEGFYHRSDTIKVVEGEEIELISIVPFTSVVFEYDSLSSIQSTTIESKSTRIILSKDEHFISENRFFHSNLITFDQEISRLRLFSGQLSGFVVVHYINGGAAPKVNSKKRNNKSINCEEPPSVDQDVWRSGLPEPDYERIYTPTKHMIVHHSAGSNSNVNYTQVVRDIYIYHTQVNGWSDIGYNYLIAQNGQIYKGRDPLSGRQDEVQGAHFCGKNSNTVGVCLMGTYTDVSPSNVTIESLIELLSWKAFKDELDPLGFMTTNGISNLKVIAGHRDGCSTECPGNVTYSLLDSIRSAVNLQVNICKGIVKNLTASFFGFPLVIDEGQFVSYVNETVGIGTYWEWNFPGGIPSRFNGKNPGQVRYPRVGLYDVQLIVHNDQDKLTDTLSRSNYVRVNQLFNPVIYPNPLTAPYIAEILNTSDESELRIEVYDHIGRLVTERVNTLNQMTLDFSQLMPGVFLVHISNSKASTTLQLVVI